MVKAWILTRDIFSMLITFVYAFSLMTHLKWSVHTAFGASLSGMKVNMSYEGIS